MITEIFFNKDIIKEQSENIIFNINIPKFKQTVLKVTKPYEGGGNSYYKVIKNNDGYKLFYRGLNYHDCYNGRTEDMQPYEKICLAESLDGLNFDKKICLSEKDGNHDLNNFCHNFFPHFDGVFRKLDPASSLPGQAFRGSAEITNQYIGISGTGKYNNGLFLFNSENGIDWVNQKKIVNPSDLLQHYCHDNHFDSHNSIVYNKFDGYYYIYIRDNLPHRRFIQFTKTKDFINFLPMKNITIRDDENEQLYNFNVFMYPNSYYFIALPLVHHYNSKIEKTSTKILYSIDGENWVCLSKNFLCVENLEELEKLYLFVNNIVESIDNTKLYFYVQNNLYSNENNCIDCFEIDKNRIGKISCLDNKEGTILLDLIFLKNNIMNINYETFENGWIIIEIINSEYETILTSSKLTENELNKRVEWIDENKNNFDSNSYYIKFTIFNCNLYSFSYEKY